jgi:hypothetical protein
MGIFTKANFRMAIDRVRVRTLGRTTATTKGSGLLIKWTEKECTRIQKSSWRVISRTTTSCGLYSDNLWLMIDFWISFSRRSRKSHGRRCRTASFRSIQLGKWGGYRCRKGVRGTTWCADCFDIHCRLGIVQWRIFWTLRTCSGSWNAG